MRGYYTYFKMEILAGVQYKVSALAGLVTQYFWGILYLFIYRSFYSKASISSISLEQLITYSWLNQAFLALIYLKIKDKQMINSIKDGTVAYELIRPYDLYTWWFIKHLTKRLASVSLRALPILIFSFLLPSSYSLKLPQNLTCFFLFFLSLSLGVFLITGINMLVDLLTFFTMQEKGISSIIYTIGNLLGGFLVALPLLPDFMIQISEYLPFRLIGDLAFRIYSGNVSYSYAYKSIVLQFIWIFVLIGVGRIVLKKALKKVCIQGG